MGVFVYVFVHGCLCMCLFMNVFVCIYMFGNVFVSVCTQATLQVQGRTLV